MSKLTKSQSELIEAVLGILTGRSSSPEIKKFVEGRGRLWLDSWVRHPLEELLKEDNDFIQLQSVTDRLARKNYFDWKRNGRK